MRELVSSVVLPITFNYYVSIIIWVLSINNFNDSFSAQVGGLIILCLQCYIEVFYTDILLKQNKLAIASLQEPHSSLLKI